MAQPRNKKDVDLAVSTPHSLCSYRLHILMCKDTLTADIRVFTAHLLRLDEEDPPLLIPASQRDLQLFDNKRHEGPKAIRGSFRLDLEGTFASQWNKRAGTVFAKAFVSSGRFQCKDLKLIAEKFNVHLRTVKKKYDGDSDEEEHDVLGAQANRLRSVSIVIYTESSDSLNAD